MYKLSSLFSSRPSWLEAFYEILAASPGHGGILMPDTIVMQYHKMSAAFASGRDLSVQKTDLVRGGRVTTKVGALARTTAQRIAVPVNGLPRALPANAKHESWSSRQSVTRAQELFDIARGGTTLGWTGHYVHEAAKNAEGVVSEGLGLEAAGVELQFLPMARAQ